MKKNAFIILVCLLGLTISNIKAQTSPATMSMPGISNPWTNSQLLEPAELAADIKAGETKTPIIFNIGAVEDIKGAIHIGAVSSAENLEKLKEAVAALSKNTAIVIYCGCCPFAKCPNIRPAFIELQKLGFTNVKLLNLSTNLKTNWIAKGYPLTKP
ncbi:rhodanese-like domain-containing protein [Mucilaginibacter sp. OK098]|uniref:rhodanese-like domain-containing protein n=1 Tax=Mucilaginibacter sp. OK098 TaxID=1855297 RepID=UPI000916EBFF|nr:rhodanese-like domain-containing protein [Mucilaginibacter sp. OK098]SHM74758.1 hypothetical protein SAMN05216524_103266 [Mucilaginibacter sp. OK098]